MKSPFARQMLRTEEHGPMIADPDKYRRRKRLLKRTDLPEIVIGLLDPRAYRHRPSSVRLIQTHISYVFLAGDFAYKVKKPVDYGFLDFTTLEKRRHFLERELILNRRLCRGMYHAVVAVKQTKKGFSIGGRGETVEYALKMKRFPPEQNFVTLLKKGRVDDALIDRIAGRIARFHAEAEQNPEIDRFGHPDTIRKNLQENFDQTRAYRGETLSRNLYEELRNYSFSFLDSHRHLFAERIRSGKIRDGHGDLHCDHVWCAGSAVYLYDCIEFNERFRYGDVASDLAFLTMDLDFRGQPEWSNRILNRYLAFSGDYPLISLLDFYQVYRAYIRGKIESFELDGTASSPQEKKRCRCEAQRYFRLAGAYARRRPAGSVFLLHGITGSGKTTLARQLAARTGGVVVSSDAVRKQMAGLPVLTPVRSGYGKGIYRREVTDRVYSRLLEVGEIIAGSGRPLVFDAGFARRKNRTRALEWARGRGLKPFVIECRVDLERIRTRLEAREATRRKESDGRMEILERLQRDFEPYRPEEGGVYFRIDTHRGLQREIRKILEALSWNQARTIIPFFLES